MQKSLFFHHYVNFLLSLNMKLTPFPDAGIPGDIIRTQAATLDNFNKIYAKIPPLPSSNQARGTNRCCKCHQLMSKCKQGADCTPCTNFRSCPTLFKGGHADFVDAHKAKKNLRAEAKKLFDSIVDERKERKKIQRQEEMAKKKEKQLKEKQEAKETVDFWKKNALQKDKDGNFLYAFKPAYAKENKGKSDQE